MHERHATFYVTQELKSETFTLGSTWNKSWNIGHGKAGITSLDDT
jgi:hypothetical protein